MELKTYRAPTMHEALAMVRHDLGPDAAVLHTREVQSRRFFGWFSGPREIEVTASLDVNVPSRLPGRGHYDQYDEDHGRDDDDDGIILRHDGPHTPAFRGGTAGGRSRGCRADPVDRVARDGAGALPPQRLARPQHAAGVVPTFY